MNSFQRIFCVWRRNLNVYMVTWKVNFLPPLLEPIFYLLAMGGGLGGYVTTMRYAGSEVNYTAFIAPGTIAITLMYQGFFECTYGSYIRMYYQKTFDAIIATPVSLEEVILGEMLWGATKSFISVSIMCVVIHALGYMKFPDLLALPLVGFLGGLFFASLAMTCTSIAPSIDSFNYPIFLLIAPMSLFGGTFFPVESLPGWGQTLSKCLPLTHISYVTRAIAFGRWTPGVAIRLAVFAAVTLPLMVLAVRLMRRRLIH